MGRGECAPSEKRRQVALLQGKGKSKAASPFPLGAVPRQLFTCCNTRRREKEGAGRGGVVGINRGAPPLSRATTGAHSTSEPWESRERALVDVAECSRCLDPQRP